MNSIFTAKYLQTLRNKKGNKGFTLIELLVVVIIIGVLAAVALPNLLAQVGKARESEGKTGVGTINRAQQTRHFETGEFVPVTNAQFADVSANPLSIAVASEYFNFDSTNPGAVGTDVLTNAGAADLATAQANGTRAFSGLMVFTTGNYASIICQTDAITNTAIAPTDAATCDAASTEVR